MLTARHHGTAGFTLAVVKVEAALAFSATCLCGARAFNTAFDQLAGGAFTARVEKAIYAFCATCRVTGDAEVVLDFTVDALAIEWVVPFVTYVACGAVLTRSAEGVDEVSTRFAD